MSDLYPARGEYFAEYRWLYPAAEIPDGWEPVGAVACCFHECRPDLGPSILLKRETEEPASE